MAQGEEKVAFPPGLDGLLQRINEAVLLVGALRAAAGADLFRQVEAAPLDAAAAAAACGLDERGARRLLAVLSSLGVLTCDQAGRYRCALPGVAHLERMLLLVDFLPETIRTGRPLVAGDTAAVAGNFYAEGVRLLDVLYREATERCADHLARPGLRILELGAGTAVWSRAIARRQPDVQVTVVDLPPVVETTRQAVAGDGLQERYAFVAADLFTGAWPADGSFDLVLVPNLCHLFGPEQNAWLLAQASLALRPGGRLAVIDVLADGRPDASVALYDLGLLTRTATGQAYSFGTFAGWLRTCGLKAVVRHELGGRPPLTVVEAFA
jgi:SAM-dependent methyltransferase